MIMITCIIIATTTRKLDTISVLPWLGMGPCHFYGYYAIKDVASSLWHPLLILLLPVPVRHYRDWLNNPTGQDDSWSQGRSLVIPFREDRGQTLAINWRMAAVDGRVAKTMRITCCLLLSSNAIHDSWPYAANWSFTGRVHTRICLQMSLAKVWNN